MSGTVVTSTSYINDSDLRLLDQDYVNFDKTTRDAARSWAYGKVNSYLAQKVPIPLKKNSDGDYDSQVKEWQTALTLYFLYKSTAPDKADEFMSMVTNEAESGIKDEFLNGVWLLDEQVSSPEKGIQQAVKYDNNSGSGNCYSNTSGEYTSEYRQTITITLTTAGASGTAVFSWQSNMETSAHTGVTTSTDWISLTDGMQVYFPDADTSEAYKAGDKWSITCIPMAERAEGNRKITSIGLLRA